MERKDLVWAADSFGEVIKKAREAKNLTQKELAKRCDDISAMYVSQIENGQRIPRARVCRLLAKALDLDERRLVLLAYRESAPKDIKDLLAKEEPAPYGERVPTRIANLVRVVSELPEEKRSLVTQVWEDALRLVHSTAR